MSACQQCAATPTTIAFVTGLFINPDRMEYRVLCGECLLNLADTWNADPCFSTVHVSIEVTKEKSGNT